MTDISLEQLSKIISGISESQTEIKGMRRELNTLFVYHEQRNEQHRVFVKSVQKAIDEKLDKFNCSERENVVECKKRIEKVEKIANANTDIIREGQSKKKWIAKAKEDFTKDVVLVATFLGIIWTLKKIGWL